MHEIIQMQTDPPSVTLSLGSAAHHKRLPAVLLRHGMLRRMLSFGSELTVLDPNGTGSLKVVRRFPEYKFANRLLWALWNRLPGTGGSQLPKVATCWLADRLASKYVPPSSIFHGWLGVSLACLQAAKPLGAITIVQSPTLHLQHWQDEVMAECERFRINPRNCGSVLPAPLIRRAQREYEKCDRIAVLSSVARRSFEQFGYASKTVVVWPGIDHVLFSPSLEQSAPTLFRVCYVGRVEVAKGIGYLLQAWERLRLARAELLLVGNLQPEVKPLLGKYAGANVRVTGWLSPEEVVERYRQSSIFVFPSANEGMGMVLLEAMACGLPVIATDKTGAPDCVTDREEGFVIAARNVEALAESILWCYKNPHETRAMGRAARAKVEREFTLAHYEARQISLYRSLAAAR
jgi:glycosyltransferase involved in cell wall biosynthesis